MCVNINVITEDNYFFIGIKEQFFSGDWSVRKIAPSDFLLSGRELKEDDVFVFYTSNYMDEFLFLITAALFPRRFFFISTTKKAKLSIIFKKEQVSLNTHAEINSILNKITRGNFSYVSIAREQDKLTTREKTVLLDTINGRSVHSIGRSLRISVKTVYTHRRNALHKLGGRNFFEIWPIKNALYTLNNSSCP